MFIFVDRCRLVCVNWLDSTENEFYFKILERPYLSDYSVDLNGKIIYNNSIKVLIVLGNYYRIFTRGGAHLIKTLQQLKDNCVPDSELRWIHYLKQGCVCACII